MIEVYKVEPDARLSADGSGALLLRDSMSGHEVLVKLETATGTTWLWFKKAQLKEFINEFLEPVEKEG